MAKRMVNDPLQDALLSALQEIAAATITHAMIQGGPELAVVVIRRIKAGLDEQESSIFEIVKENGYSPEASENPSSD